MKIMTIKSAQRQTSKGISRREMLKRSAAITALATATVAWKPWMPRVAFAKDNIAGDVLVCVFLRGGADGLNIIVPHGDASYYTARPRLAIAKPDNARIAVAERAIDLDGFFGINPALSPMLPLFQAGQMVAVHGTGSPDPTRSHFDAMSYMERGTPGSYTVSSGWIGRHLATQQNGNDSAVRAIGWGSALQQSLRGWVNSVSLKSIVDYHLQGRQEAANEMLAALNALYAASPEEIEIAARQTNAVIDLVSKIDVKNYVPANGATYQENNEFHLALKQTAALIKAQVGMEVSAIDLGGWDTHQNQAVDLSNNLAMLSSGLAAFHADMGEMMGKVTIVVMSEFGRRVQENASNGTDHGHGNMMMVLGQHVAAQPVVSNWVGLHPDQLTQGDLTITIDYRDVLGEILTNRLKNPNVAEIFPNHAFTPPGVVRA
jgi:uncharacterized protein (DUF1501 family)